MRKILVSVKWIFAVIVMTLLVACQASGNHLSAKVVQIKEELEVTGQSDLPDQALILISLLDPQKAPEMNRNVIIQEFAQVKAGNFTARLKPLKAIPAGKYYLRLRFSPDSYDPSKGIVTEAVGTKGEKLKGSQVVKEGDTQMLESIQEINYTS